GEHEAGQAGAAADVGDARAGGDGLGGGGAVAQVAVPEAGNLARADQAADNAFGGEQAAVGGEAFDGVGTERGNGGGRGRREFVGLGKIGHRGRNDGRLRA